VYPVLFRLGTVEITSFAVIVAIGILVGLHLFEAELRRSRLSEHGTNAAVFGAIGGLAGARTRGPWRILVPSPSPISCSRAADSVGSVA
jgi:prolipoprotein diacylglyceryltransferase